MLGLLYSYSGAECNKLTPEYVMFSAIENRARKVSWKKKKRRGFFQFEQKRVRRPALS